MYAAVTARPLRGMIVLAALAVLVPHGTARASGLDSGAVAARVGGEPIYVGEIVEGAASLALVGQQEVGERPGTREQLLERLVVAHVLFLDGEARGLERDPRLVDEVAAAEDATLAARWLEQLRRRECDATGPACADPGTRRATEVARLRAASAVTIDDDALDPSADATRAATAPIGRIGDRVVRWRRVEAAGGTLGRDRAARSAAVGRVVDTILLADAARAAGFDRDPGFAELRAVWRRGAVVRLVRAEVIAAHGLDDAGVEREYARHRASFTLPAERQVQQIVVRTRAEADDIRRLLASPPAGVSFYTVARDRSIVPNAATTLGVVGWVRRDQGHPALSAATFALAPGAISDPVETDAGVHLIRVLAERPEETLALDEELRARIRARWNANRIAEYAQHLTETTYPVTLYPETYRSETTAQR